MINTILRSHYKIIQVLGQGGFGETYIAEDIDRPDKPRFVVKRLFPHVIDPTVIRLFEQEAQMLYILGTHEQIPNLKAHFQENNDFYLIQDLIIGHDLSYEMKPGKQCHENMIIKFLKDVSTVLSFVHENKVIHRDIKPQNIIRRDGDGKLFLIDFGAVKQVKQTVLSGVTSKSVAIGTPGYMPSEQAIGRPKYSSDIYALGMTAIHGLTGKLPHELPVDNDDEIIWTNLVSANPQLIEIVSKMVRFRAGDRYQNAGELLAVLNQVFPPKISVSGTNFGGGTSTSIISSVLSLRYKVIEQIGKGGFGETYIAEDIYVPSKPRYVLKRLLPDVVDPDIIRLFEQEAKILDNLGTNHEQIPALIAHFQENNDFYLVQDLIIGNDLSQEITPGKLCQEGYVIELLKDVLNVLSFVHNNNVIHRDIKPQNIIRRQGDGKLFLIDFGAVKQVKQTVLNPGISSKRTITIGTPGYMPSEQVLGKPRFSSDIYALGMTAIQALTGKFPHQLPANNDDEIIWRNLVNVNGQLADILSKMVRFRASDRYDNAGEVLAVLNQVFSPIPQIVTPEKTKLIVTPQPPQIITPPKPDPLITAKANYHQLDQLLAQKKWKDADEETAKIMFKIMGREKERYLREEDCKNFPKDELKIIDQLWVKYSNGHFGFSVQKAIFTNAKVGGKVGRYDYGIWCKFGEEVGWRKKGRWLKEGNWLDYSELSFTILPSNKGHLPNRVGRGRRRGGGWRGGFYVVVVGFLALVGVGVFVVVVWWVVSSGEVAATGFGWRLALAWVVLCCWLWFVVGGWWEKAIWYAWRLMRPASEAVLFSSLISSL